MPTQEFLPQPLIDATRHVFGADRSENMLRELRRHRVQNYPIAEVVQGNLVSAMQLIDWKHVSNQEMIRAIKQIPNLQLDGRGVNAMGDVWPMWLVPWIANGEPPAFVSVNPDKIHSASCDLFVQLANEVGAAGPSVSPVSGLSGLAVECKAIQSLSGLRSGIKEAKRQLQKYGCGIVAIDISIPMRDSCLRIKDINNDRIYEQCEEFLKFHLRDIEGWIRRQTELLKVIKGIILHGCILSHRHFSKNVEKGCLVYHYSGAKACATLLGNESVDAFVSNILLRIIRISPRMLIVPPPGFAFVTRENAELEVEFDENHGDYSVRLVSRDPSLPLGEEAPIQMINSILVGRPSQASGGKHLIWIGRTRLPYPHDMYVRSSRLIDEQNRAPNRSAVLPLE